MLSPLGLDPARPFPRIQNKSLNFIVRLAGQDAFGRDTGLAIVQAPRSLPRVVALPEADGRKRFVLLTGIVQQFVSKLFSGMEVLGCYQFRVTRNSDLFVDDEEVDDLRRALEGELAHRRYGAAVRLEVSQRLPAGSRLLPDAAIRPERGGFLRGFRTGQPQPARGHLRSRAAAGSQIPDLHAGVATSSRRLHRPAGGHSPEGRLAAPPVPQLRTGARFPAWCSRGSAGARHQADAVPHRQRITDRRCAGLRRAVWQGRDRHRRTARAIRRRSQHRTVQPPAGSRSARDVWRGRLQDSRQDVDGGAPRSRWIAPVLSSWHRQLSPADSARLYGLQPVHLRPDDWPGRARDVPAAHQPDPDAAAHQTTAVAVRIARESRGEDRARGTTCRGRKTRAYSSPR